jgi:hypothetical protein
VKAPSNQALRTAQRLVHDAWLARAGLAIIPRSELAALQRIAERERERLARGGPWTLDARLLWKDLLRAGMPVEFGEAGPQDYCPTCGTAAEQRTCIACGVTVWTVECQHMLPPPIALGLADGSDAGEFYCVTCACAPEGFR